MSETPTLARFHLGKVQDGLSEDGLPYYRDTLKIVLSRPPYLRLEREATEQDRLTYREPYELFLKEQAAKTDLPEDEPGFPLALWPACSPAQLAMLAARGVTTVEALVKLMRERPAGIPGEIAALGKRAIRMADMQREVGQFEIMISERDDQIVVLGEQIRELKAQIETQNSIIASLKQRVA